ncbi:MAG: RecX family transcriptional regulator [Bacteroides sp.]|nr:RecX family transcriptional regulator [Ruminococcus flavefaciens]MCM1555049.1 RecX family transcriptional regulator [Bacteroides sp.]MCM1555500.1 RecX family transcriptional regulator [Bacteroides sp.]
MENSSFENLYAKISRYCAYQERSSGEVRQKLRLLGADSDTSRKLLQRLLDDNFVNEERFARAYVRGKFRINGWGRLKIRNGLRAKGVDEKLIQTALREEISENEYAALLQRTVTEKGPKTALSRGFEPSLIRFSE